MHLDAHRFDANPFIAVQGNLYLGDANGGRALVHERARKDPLPLWGLNETRIYDRRVFTISIPSTRREENCEKDGQDKRWQTTKASRDHVSDELVEEAGIEKLCVLGTQNHRGRKPTGPPQILQDRLSRRGLRNNH